MSFLCQICNKASQAGEKENRTVKEKRTRTYHYYIVKFRVFGKDKIIITESKEFAERKEHKILKQFTTRGWEISKELKICGNCVKTGDNNENCKK